MKPANKSGGTNQQPSKKQSDVFVLPEPSPAIKVETDRYIDDFLSGHNSVPEAKQMMAEESSIIANSSFKFKQIVYFGDHVE